MSSGGSPRRAREVHQDQDYEGMNTIVHADTLPSNSSTCQLDPNQEDPRYLDGVNLLLKAAEFLECKELATSHPYYNQGDQRHYEDLNTLPPPISTLISNSSTSQSDPDQQHARSGAHPSTSTSLLKRLSYTQEQEETICSLKDDSKLSWDQVVVEYHRRCYADKTPWEPRSKEALRKRYRQCKSGKARLTSTSKSRPIHLGYTKEQEETLCKLHDDTPKRTWDQIAEEYNRRCYEDGTPWEPRSKGALSMRYYILNAHSHTSDFARMPYTKDQEEYICFLKDDRCLPWAQIEAEYNTRCYEDGTPWEPRSSDGLKARYFACRLQAWVVASAGKQDGDLDMDVLDDET